MNEDLLTTELTRRADDVVAPPLTFEDVRGRAHGIRRRRRAAGTAAVAAVAALAIVVPTVLGGGSGRSDGVDPAPSPPVGQGASVLHEGVVTLPGGDEVPLDVRNQDVGTFGVLSDGRILVASNRPQALQVFGPDGELITEHPIGTTLVRMSPSNDAAAWMEGDGTIQVLASGTDEPVELGTVKTGGLSYPMIDAVLDADRVLVGDGNTTTTEVTPDGRTPLAASEPLRVTDVSPDGALWSIQVDGPDPQYGCSGLYDPAADEVVARNCDTSGLQFSPDGQHLLGMRGDNNTFSEAATFDLDLEEVGRFESAGEGHVISRAGWADATHLVVAETDWRTSEWSLVRVGLDWGGSEVVAPQARGGNAEITLEFIISE